MTLRTCPECGAEFTPANGRQRFCTPVHKRAYHHLMAHRGQMLLTLSLTARGYRPGPSERKRLKGQPDPRKELASWARRQESALLSRWNREDATAGRKPELVAAEKMAAKWRAVDADT